MKHLVKFAKDRNNSSSSKFYAVRGLQGMSSISQSEIFDEISDSDKEWAVRWAKVQLLRNTGDSEQRLIKFAKEDKYCNIRPEAFRVICFNIMQGQMNPFDSIDILNLIKEEKSSEVKKEILNLYEFSDARKEDNNHFLREMDIIFKMLTNLNSRHSNLFLNARPPGLGAHAVISAMFLLPASQRRSAINVAVAPPRECPVIISFLSGFNPS